MTKKLVLLPLAILLIMLLTSSVASADIRPWTRTGADFTGTGNTSITSMIVFGSYLYAGTSNASGAQIWRTLDGITWYKTGADFTGMGNTSISSMTLDHVTGGGYLYAGTSNASGAQIWRTLDGITWYKTGADFTGTGNTSITSMCLSWRSYFSGRWYGGNELYAGTSNASGAQIWRSWGNDGMLWTRTGADFTGTGNTSITAMDVYGPGLEPYLHAGTSNASGAQIWRSWGNDGMLWTKEADFSGTGNTLVIFGDYWNLWAGTSNASGAEIWVNSSGSTWSMTDADFTGTGNTAVTSMGGFSSLTEPDLGYVYAGTSNASGGQIWRKLCVWPW